MNSENCIWTATVEIEINLAFLLAVMKCILQRKDMRYTHTFKSNPFIGSTGQ